MTRLSPSYVCRIVSLFFVVVGIVSGGVRADVTTVGLGPTPFAIPVPVFDQGLGWLTDVRFDYTLRAGQTSTETFFGGSHNHNIAVPVYSSNGLTTQGFSFATATGGSTIGNHSHATPQITQTLFLSGGGLAPFLGPSNFSINTPTLITSTNSGHNHTLAPVWSTLTRFTYEQNTAPTAIQTGNPVLVYGDTLALSGSSSFDPDVICGDSIVNYAWDLDNDGTFDFSGASADLNLDLMDYENFIQIGSNQIALRVMDQKGATHIDFFTLNAVPEPSQGLLLLVGSLVLARSRRKSRSAK